MSDTTLLDNPAFVQDCRDFSQREIERKYGDNGTGRALLRSYYAQARNGHAEDTPEPPTTTTEERADYQVASFFGEESPVAITPEIVDESCENLQLQVAPISNTLNPAHSRRAKYLHDWAVTQTADLFETLDAIRQEKAFLSLGYTSFELYLKALKKEAEYLSIDVTTFYRKLAHREVKTALHEAGIDTRNLTQQQSALLNKLPPEMQAEAFRLAQDTSDAEPPAGPAAAYHHPGKVYLGKLEEAVTAVTNKTLDEIEDGEPDTYEDETPVILKSGIDFFSPESRAKALNDAKPLPPAATEPHSAETEQEPIRLVYVRMARYTGKEGDFIWAVGDDGNDLYEIPIRVSDVREMLK